MIKCIRICKSYDEDGRVNKVSESQRLVKADNGVYSMTHHFRAEGVKIAVVPFVYATSVQRT